MTPEQRRIADGIAEIRETTRQLLEDQANMRKRIEALAALADAKPEEV